MTISEYQKTMDSLNAISQYIDAINSKNIELQDKLDQSELHVDDLNKENDELREEIQMLEEKLAEKEGTKNE